MSNRDPRGNAAVDAEAVTRGESKVGDFTSLGTEVCRRILGGQKGLEMGKGFEMIDGGNFNGAKAYKDAKMCNMMTVNELHKRWVTAAGSRALARSLPVSIAAEHCSAAFQLPREHGHHVLEPLPRLHRDDQPVP